MKILSLLFMVMLIASCDTTTKNGDGSSAVTGNGYGNSGYTEGGIRTGNLADIVPGSQEDLVANIGDRVFFGFNSSSLSTSAQKTLVRQSKWLKNKSSGKITIEGHCDERGTREFNLALGERRATAVRNYLVELGVDEANISVISYGKEHPEYPSSDEVSWSKNRRAVTVVGE